MNLDANCTCDRRYLLEALAVLRGERNADTSCPRHPDDGTAPKGSTIPLGSDALADVLTATFGNSAASAPDREVLAEVVDMFATAPTPPGTPPAA